MRVFIIISMMLLSGCSATQYVWEDDYTNEHFIGYHVNEDAQQLTVQSDMYEYQFQISEPLVESLKLAQNSQHIVESIDIKGDKSLVWGTVFLNSEGKYYSDDDIAILSELENRPVAYHSSRFNESIQGYELKEKSNLVFTPFERERKREVLEPDSPIEIAGQVIATPFAMAFDTVVIVGATIFFLPLMMTGQ